MGNRRVIITPHLSTGGLPQYVAWYVGRLLEERADVWADVWVVEWNNIAPIYRVQKDKLREMLGERLIVWDQGIEELEKTRRLRELLEEVNPEVVHIAEFPEGFLGNGIEVVYSPNRTWKVIETTHDSRFEPEKKVSRPDKIEVVSEWHLRKFEKLGIPCELVEYQVEKKVRPERDKSLRELGLDPEWKHVLNVGLFTPGKNQKELWEVARLLEDSKVMVHFVGNQAENFRDYWQPLMDSVPSNVKVWGEQTDVDKFYKSMDLLVFSSLSELMPLVPIEALSWQMPVMMRKSERYGNKFNEEDVEWYETGGESLKWRIECRLGLEWMPKTKVVHLLTRSTDTREVKSVRSLQELSNWGVEYTQHTNEPETEYPDKPPLSRHKVKQPGYWGAYKAFRQAFEDEFDDDVEVLVVCECDCTLQGKYREFVERLRWVVEEGLEYASFGQTEWSQKIEQVGDVGYLTDKIILAHCVCLPRRSRRFLLDKLDTLPWDSPNLWLDKCFEGKRKGVLYEPIAWQYEGVSLIDKDFKMGGPRVKVVRDKVEDPKVEVRVSFIDGPKVEILGEGEQGYDVEFVDKDTNQMVYQSRIKPGHWSKSNRKRFCNWVVKVKLGEKVVREIEIDLRDKKVFIELGSKALGDTLAWFPYVEEFRKVHECEVWVSSFWNNLFEETYPGIKFVKPGEVVHNIYAKYFIGCIDDDVEGIVHKQDWRVVPLQKVCSDILGLEYKEIRPRLGENKLPRHHKKKYIAIGEFATLKAKYWNRPNGWKELVEKIRLAGYDVMSVSKEKSKLTNVRRCNGRRIEETIRNIYYSEAFIGVSSGLSWLAWALGKPVVLVSGFSEKFCEMSGGVERVINEEVCHGCVNDVEYVYDRGNWEWCPRGEDFVCSKSITPDEVFNSLMKALGSI